MQYRDMQQYTNVILITIKYSALICIKTKEYINHIHRQYLQYLFHKIYVYTQSYIKYDINEKLSSS